MGEMLTKADVPVCPVKDIEEVLEDPQVAAREMIQEISLANGKKSARWPSLLSFRLHLPK